MNTPINNPFEDLKEMLVQGQVEACLLGLKRRVQVSDLSELTKKEFLQRIDLLRARSVEINKTQRNRTKENQEADKNKLRVDILSFIDLVKEACNKSKAIPPLEKKTKVEIKLDLDYDNTTEEEIKAYLNQIEQVLRLPTDSLIIINKRKGSVIIELDLDWEDVRKIKSLIRLGVIDKLKGIKVTEEFWDIYFENHTNQKDVIDLSGADLSGADLSGADLSGADLFEANLSRADLSGIDLSGADLSGANLFEANLFGAYLIEANLFEANLFEANLFEAYLIEANLSRAYLSRANLSRADLSGANLILAHLSGANLSRTNLSGAHFTGANLKDAIFHESQESTLLRMDIDISQVIFIDDDGENVKTGEFVPVQ